MLECPTHGTALLIDHNRRTLRLLYLTNQPSYERRSFDGGCHELVIVALFNPGTAGIGRTNPLLPSRWLQLHRRRVVVGVSAQ